MPEPHPAIKEPFMDQNGTDLKHNQYILVLSASYQKSPVNLNFISATAPKIV